MTGACGQSAAGEPPKANLVTYHFCGGSGHDGTGNLTYDMPCPIFHNYGTACTEPSVPDRNNVITWGPPGCDANNPDSGNNPSKGPGAGHWPNN